MSTQLADQETWLNWRSKGIGASDAAAVCGASRYRSRYQVWLEKTGQASGQSENEAMKWGHRLEPVVLEAYRERTGLTTGNEQLRREHVVLPWMRATLDAMAGEHTLDRLVEVKVAGLGTAQKLGEDGDTDSLPTEWVLQGQHQLAVTGLVLVDFAVFHPSLELRIYPLYRDEDLIAALVETEAEFWECVQDQTPPEPSTLEDVGDWTRRCHTKGSRRELNYVEGQMALRYAELGDHIKRLQADRDHVKQSLLVSMAGTEYGELRDRLTVRVQTVDVPERTQTIKAHTQVRLTVKESKP